MAGLYRMLRQAWILPKDPQDSFQGKTIIVTGANSGVGFESAAKFAALGASKVILAVRSSQKGEQAKATIETRTGKKDPIDVWQLDMESYESIQKFADRASNELKRLDVVVLNAGVYKKDFTVSPHGWEDILQVNVISTTLLALLLLPTLKKSKVVTQETPVLEFISSGYHQSVQISDDHLNSQSLLKSYNNKETYNVNVQYPISKLFITMVQRKLALQISSANLVVTAVCPGAAATDLGRDFTGSLAVKMAFKIFAAVFMRTPEQGSRSLVSGAILGEKVHGRFWQHDEIKPVAPTLSGPENEKIMERVWYEIIVELSKEVPAVTELSKLSW